MKRIIILLLLMISGMLIGAQAQDGNPAPTTGLGGLLQSFINAGNATPDNQTAQSSVDTNSGLVLHYDFNAEPVGGKIPDLSGHGNDGQAVGVQWVAEGHQGGAVLFGLTNSYITVPNNDSINPQYLTLSAWIKITYQDRIWRRIFDKCYNKGYDLTMGGDDKGKSYRGRVYMETVLGGVNTPNQVTDGNWHHVVAALSSSDAKIYLDGWLAGVHSHKAGVLAKTPYDLTIGANRSNPDASLGEVGSSFNGMMDDVMMFNRALSDDEVQELFKSQGGVLGPKPSPPPPAGTPAKPSAADRLKQLKNLLDQGLINQDEYDQKKKEIIDSM
jgi:hypothetical protein